MSEQSPRIPRDRVLTIGGAFWLATTLGIMLWSAGFIAWHWIAQ